MAYGIKVANEPRQVSLGITSRQRSPIKELLNQASASGAVGVMARKSQIKPANEVRDDRACPAHRVRGGAGAGVSARLPLPVLILPFKDGTCLGTRAKETHLSFYIFTSL